jgi:NADH-quinone oxidoreductase subunit L
MVNVAATGHDAATVHVVGTHLLRWIILLPALGFLWNAFLGRRLPWSVKLVGPGVVLAAFVVSVLAILQLHALPEHGALRDLVFSWMQVGTFQVDAGLWLDPLSAVMVLVVTGVGFLIHVYAIGYMDHDPDVPRFFTYLNLFITAMLILVLADNLLLLFVGWEGVGLCSYLLIGFWWTDSANATAGKKAMLANRVGDACFLIALFLLIQFAGTLSFQGLNGALEHLRTATLGGWSVPLLVCLLFLLGATGKSAQIPLYVWLPDAMAGPTPVSALIHAATMVTAGVYLTARLHGLYALAPEALAAVAVVGAATALFAATIAVTQTDIKKVLAYSTVSQLGYMFLGVGVGLPGAAVWHLVTHAFFKGLLFLCAGSVIHAMGGEQDMRKMGGLRGKIPITFATMLIGTLAIAGVPPLSGFWSKDEILWGAFAGPHPHPVLGVVGYVAAAFTAFYMGRMLFLTFFGPCRADHHTQEHLHESPLVMTLPLMVLAVLSAVGGWIPVPHVVEQVTGHVHLEHAPPAALALAIALALGGLALAWFGYVTRPDVPGRIAEGLGGVYRLVRDKYRIDELYDAVIYRPLLACADTAAWVVDRGMIDGIVNGVGTLVVSTSGAWRRMQSGNVQHYALSFLAGALALVAWYLVR